MGSKKKTLKIVEENTEQTSAPEESSPAPVETPVSEVTESKEAKFIRLGQKRMKRVLHDLNSIGKLSNRNNYAYTDKQVDQIFIALNNAFSQLKGKFTKQTQKPTFQF